MQKDDTRNHATEAQIRANRENAKRSTGPRTAEGKAASSRNGLSHGLCAEKLMLSGEDPEEFLMLLKKPLRYLSPFRPGRRKIGHAHCRLPMAPRSRPNHGNRHPGLRAGVPSGPRPPGPTLPSARRRPRTKLATKNRVLIEAIQLY